MWFGSGEVMQPSATANAYLLRSFPSSRSRTVDVEGICQWATSSVWIEPKWSPSFPLPPSHTEPKWMSPKVLQIILPLQPAINYLTKCTCAILVKHSGKLFKISITHAKRSLRVIFVWGDSGDFFCGCSHTSIFRKFEERLLESSCRPEVYFSSNWTKKFVRLSVCHRFASIDNFRPPNRIGQSMAQTNCRLWCFADVAVVYSKKE